MVFFHHSSVYGRWWVVGWEGGGNKVVKGGGRVCEGEEEKIENGIGERVGYAGVGDK